MTRAPSGTHPPQLRPMAAADLDGVLEMNQHWVPHVGSLDRDSLDALRGEADLALVATLRDALAGFVIVLGTGADYASPNYRFFARRHERFTYVDRVAVTPDALRAGIGGTLYRAVIDHAQRSDSPVVCAEVNVDPPNPGSQRFHTAHGFVEVARQWTYRDTVQVQLLERVL